MDYQGYNSRWETLISNRDSVDIVEIVTWNDYGESSYIGPIEGAQPAGTTWTSGFDHTGMLSFIIFSCPTYSLYMFVVQAGSR